MNIFLSPFEPEKLVSRDGFGRPIPRLPAQLHILRQAGGLPRESTRFSLSVENKQADAGRDSRTCLARPKSQARTGKENFSFSLFI